MTAPLTVTQLNAIENRRNEFPLVWCVEVPIPDEVTPQVLRVTSHSTPVEWQTDSDGNPLTWTPWSIDVGAIDEDTKGTQQTWRLTLSNANRQIMALVDAYEGLEESSVTAHLVPLLALAEGVGVVTLRGRILAISATQDALTFELGQVDLRRAKLPARRVSATYCGSAYKSEQCGYTGALPTCDKGLNTPNGCVAHANENRFGGFPGVPQ